ncbi:MAG TPA: heme exporter protein CcmB [Gammaproteobacteria bacterium]|nr:heme exporter protein CcmB [Gammaproteobacteria bacterium]
MNNFSSRSTASATNGSVLNTLMRLFLRDCKHHLRKQSDILNPLCFFIIICSLFPLGLSAERELLNTIGGGVIWVSILLSLMMGLNQLFRDDYEAGVLEQFLFTNTSLTQVVLAKIAAYWCVSALPMIILSPIVGTAYHLTSDQILVLVMGLALGSPTLALLGSIGSALTLNLKNGGVLLAILILPLFAPVLIFGAGMVNAVHIGLPVNAQLSILGALLFGSLSLAPFATSFALKNSLDY